MSIIYLDHAATTPMRPEVIRTMLPFFREQFGNPSSGYQIGVEARQALEEARTQIAGAIAALPEEIYFTSGGTESDNWALVAAARHNRSRGRHIITTQIEHHAILHTCAYLETEGFEVTYLPVNELGLVSIEALSRAIRPDTTLISVMFANNEIGTLQPIEQIGRLAKEHGIWFHTDAVQAFGQVPIDVNALHIDLLSASAHKCYGPKGVGLLYIRKERELSPLLHGGAQEGSRRAGTENVAGIVGFGEAVRYCMETMEERIRKEKYLQERLMREILATIPYARINGSRKRRLPANVHVSFQFIDGENLRTLLDMDGICTSGGSACTSGQKSPSHVLRAIGLSSEVAGGSVRMTLGEENTEAEIEQVIAALRRHVRTLRRQSPYDQQFTKRLAPIGRASKSRTLPDGK